MVALMNRRVNRIIAKNLTAGAGTSAAAHSMINTKYSIYPVNHEAKSVHGTEFMQLPG
jgi:hypothetical protein